MATLVYEDFPGVTTEYKVNFEYLDKSDVYVGQIDETETLTPITTGWTWKDDTTIEFTEAPGGTIRVYRVTSVDEPIATFYPTVAIRAIDLNNNFDQCLFSLQELNTGVLDINSDIDSIREDIDNINEIINELAGITILNDVQELNEYVPQEVDERVIVLDSTGWSDVTVDVTSVPPGFVGSETVRVNLTVTQVDPIEYVFFSSTPADPENRYVNKAGDNMTGDLTIATDKIQLNTDGTASFKPSGDGVNIDSLGRLRVGTTTPGDTSADDLVVSSDSNTGITIRSGTTNTSALYMSDGTSGADQYRGYVFYHHDGDFMQFGTNGSNAMRIDSSGNVGIGGTLPSSPNISLKADGSASFAGIVETEGTRGGFISGQVPLVSADTTWGVWSGKNYAGSTTSQIKGDGSAFFASEDIQLSSTGAAYFKGIITTGTGIEFPDGSIQTTATGGSGGGESGLWSTEGSALVPTNRDKDVAIGTASGAFTFNTFKDLIEYIPADFIRDHADAIATLDLDQAFNEDAITDPTFRTAVQGITRATAAGKINLNADGSATFAGGDVNIDSDGGVNIGTSSNPFTGSQLQVNTDAGSYFVTIYGHLLLQNKNASTTDWWSLAPRNDGRLTLGNGAPDANGVVSDEKFVFNGDGSATFAGTLNVGKVGSDTQTIITNDGIIYNGNTGDGNFRNVINGTNGTATFASTVTTGALRCFDAAETVRVKSARTSGDIFTLWNGATSVNDGTKVASIQGDGSATFAGKVGIGLNNPAYALDVASSDSATGYAARLRANDTAGSCGIQFTSSTNPVTLYANIFGNSDQSLSFGTGGGGSEKMRIDANGKVGIGESSPSVKLHHNKAYNSSNSSIQLENINLFTNVQLLDALR